MSKSCPQEIKDSVLENPNFDIKQLPIVYFSENKNSEELRDQFIKNTIKQAECEITDLAKNFFSDANIDLINKQLVLRVYNKSNKKYKIPFQSKDDLMIVMRYVWIQYSRNLDFKIKEQITELNCHVVSEILPQVLSNIEQYYGYLKDYEQRENSNFQVNELPVNTKMTRGTIELPSISETFQSLYKAPKFKIPKVIDEKVQCLKPVFDYRIKNSCKKPVSNNCKVNNCGYTYNTNINIFNSQDN